MSNFRKTLLHGFLIASMALLPASAFGYGDNDEMKNNIKEDKDKPEMYMPDTDKTGHPEVEQTSSRFRFGVYYGRPYYYRPYYYYYPYRPYYYRPYYHRYYQQPYYYQW